MVIARVMMQPSFQQEKKADTDRKSEELLESRSFGLPFLGLDV